MSGSRSHLPRISCGVRLRRGVLRLLPAILGLALGCSPEAGGGGCEEPPRATDASAVGVEVQNDGPPCTASQEGVRGSSGRLVGVVYCPGTSDPFLVAVKVDGKLISMQEARGAGFGTQVTVDAGAWEAADTLWHQAELIVDPLNLFKETDETNNRAVSQVRTVLPDVGINDALCGLLVNYSEVTQITAGTTVLVRASAIIRGRYRTYELAARSGTALNFADTLSATECASLVGGSPIIFTNWTPGPGTYQVSFSVTPLSGEPERDPGNNVTTRTLTVVPGPVADKIRR